MMEFDEDAVDAIFSWIEQLTDEDFDGDDVTALSDGVLLCKLVNVIQPGSVETINEDPSVFGKVENIKAYLQACKEIGIDDGDLFEISDLTQDGDSLNVLLNLAALGREAKKRGFPYPKLDLEQSGGLRRSELSVNEYRQKRYGQLEDEYQEDMALRPLDDDDVMFDKTPSSDELIAQVGGLNTRLHFAVLESEGLLQSKLELQTLLKEKESQVNRLKMQLEEREGALHEFAQKQQLILIDLQLLKRDNEFYLQKEREMLMTIEDLKRERNQLKVEKMDSRMNSFFGRPTYNLREEKDRKKFIEKEKKELKKMEKKREKEKEKEKEKEEKDKEKEEKDKEKEKEKEKDKEKDKVVEKSKDKGKEGDGEEERSRPKMTQRLRSFTVSKLSEKDKATASVVNKDFFLKEGQILTDKLSKVHNGPENGSSSPYEVTTPEGSPPNENRGTLKHRSTTERFLSKLRKKEEKKREEGATPGGPDRIPSNEACSFSD